MKARETEFDGVLFRSRLEAKWACWFMAWGLRYEYEPARFGNDRRGYLPDFYLPTWRVYLEIKPAVLFGRVDAGIKRAMQAARYMPKPLWMAFGEPLPRRYCIEVPDGPCGFPSVLAQCRRCHSLCYLRGDGRTIEGVWDGLGDAWGDIGRHTCRNHERQPALSDTDALAASYRNGQRMWRWL